MRLRIEGLSNLQQQFGQVQGIGKRRGADEAEGGKKALHAGANLGSCNLHNPQLRNCLGNARRMRSLLALAQLGP